MRILEYDIFSTPLTWKLEDWDHSYSNTHRSKTNINFYNFFLNISDFVNNIQTCKQLYKISPNVIYWKSLNKFQCFQWLHFINFSTNIFFKFSVHKKSTRSYYCSIPSLLCKFLRKNWRDFFCVTLLLKQQLYYSSSVKFTRSRNLFITTYFGIQTVIQNIFRIVTVDLN